MIIKNECVKYEKAEMKHNVQQIEVKNVKNNIYKLPKNDLKLKF